MLCIFSDKNIDNTLSVILNSQNSTVDFSKKGVPMCYGIIEPYQLKGEYNTSDITTKQIPCKEFRINCAYIY